MAGVTILSDGGCAAGRVTSLHARFPIVCLRRRLVLLVAPQLRRSDGGSMIPHNLRRQPGGGRARPAEAGQK